MSIVVEKIKGLLSQDRKKPTFLSQTELDRRDDYVYLYPYFDPPVAGLYRATIQGDQKLYEYKKWTDADGITVQTYPPHMWAAFNPVREAVRIDAAALMNGFKPQNIVVEGSEQETTFAQKVLEENDFYIFFQDLFSISGSQGDAYVRPIEADTSEFPSGIELLTYQPDQVFPVFDPINPNKVITYRIYYQKDILEETNLKRHIYTLRQNIEHYEVITPEGHYCEIDGEVLVDEPKYYGGYLPMVHFAHNTSNGFFGTPTCRDIIDDIDHINLCYTSIFTQMKRMLHPQVWNTGFTVKDSEFKLGVTKCYSLGEHGRMGVINFPIDGSHLESLRMLVESCRSKLPHYQVEHMQMSKAPARPETVEAMHSGFVAYANMLMNVQKKNISDLVNCILRVGMGITQSRIVNIDMGPAVDEAVKSQLDRFNQQISIVGKVEPLIRKMLETQGLEEEEIDEIVEGMNAEKEQERQDKENDPERKLKAGTENLFQQALNKYKKPAKKEKPEEPEE